MKHVSIRTLITVLFGIVCTASQLLAQDPVTVAPDIYKVLLENERVRVLDQHLRHGFKEPMHSHPACAKYLLTPFKGTVTRREGTTSVRTVKAGHVVWHEAETHAEANLGKNDLHSIIVELKAAHIIQSKKGDGPNDPVKVAAKTHKTLFENDRVHVIDFRIQPGDSTALHHHKDRVMYVVSGGKIQETLSNGSAKQKDLTTGATVWNEEVTHKIKNMDTTDVHVVTFELKD